jgi:hypothetical protein
MVTDPIGDAWIAAASGNENGDLCLTNFGPDLGGSGNLAWNEQINGGNYYLQEEWSNADGQCEARARQASISFLATTPTPAAWWYFFLAHAHAPQGSVVGYRWFFGDGRRASGRVANHGYAKAGRYRVILRATDSWGNWSFYARTVVVRRGRAARGARVTKSG